MNWVFYLDRWYQVTPQPVVGEYKLSIPGERGYIILNRKQFVQLSRLNLKLKLSHPA
ncbi:hypothetical protein [Enterobacter sp.]|uniref:hypothetical protein n=1 Tax=Enterobacter sp. TaxID=42895 RepID=UPI00296F1A65|nr:hypothetical protein [Enterobacter sp.]